MEKNEEIRRELTDHIAPFWTSLRDDVYGGWYGYLSYDLQLDKKAEKGCILNSRITWFFTNLYMLTGDAKYLEQARHGYEFMMDHCLDREKGGVFWSVDYAGKPLDTTKHTYNQAFAIYALSSWYDATGDEKARRLAEELFDLIESKCRDDGGYLEAFDRDFLPASNEKLSENGVMAARTMNTLLHVIEGYTELYRVTKDGRVGDALSDALCILADRMYNPEKHREEVFFDREYHSLIDLYSYGHDIETSWLADRALEVLEGRGPKTIFGAGGLKAASAENEAASHAETVSAGKPEYLKTVQKVRPVLADLTCQVYAEPFSYTGESLPTECEKGVVNQVRVWWVQCEGIIGFVNGFQRDGKPEYLDAAKKLWQYTKTHMIDPRKGSEWFWDLHEDGTPREGRPIVEPWKCPYHNGRMCMEILRRGIEITK